MGEHIVVVERPCQIDRTDDDRNQDNQQQGKLDHRLAGSASSESDSGVAFTHDSFLHAHINATKVRLDPPALFRFGENSFVTFAILCALEDRRGSSLNGLFELVPGGIPSGGRMWVSSETR